MSKHRFKRIHSKKNRTMIALVIMLLLCMGIGYAALTSSLSITGNTEIASNTWNIHFENANDTSTGTTEIINHATISGTNNSMITYGIKLKNNNDTYEFTANIVNSGSIPGKVSLSEMSGLSTEAAQYIDYTVTYANGNPVEVDDILNAGASKSIRVRVFYKDGVTLDENLSLSLYYNLEFIQSEEDYDPINPQIRQLINDNTSCFTKYEGLVTDSVGETVQASNVYFNQCADKRNIIFNNMCWQMIRTTETGGIKMIYNGEVVNDKCESTRGNHKGIVGASGDTTTLNAEYLYGDSFTYDTETNTFTLTDTITATWSGSTYEDLIGKFTCKNTEGTCTTLYNVNGYSNSTTAYTSSYTIGDTNYAQIGTSAYNANYRSPAMVGYMFNKVYNYKSGKPGTTEYKFGSEFTYDESTNTYTLSGTTQNISDWSTGYNTINNTHYTCWNTSGSCTTICYVYYTYYSSASSPAYYFYMNGGKGVSDILGEMLSNDDVNRYNSSIKGIIDAWYKQNMLSKTNMLEDTVYCNARNITDYGGLNPNGGSTTSRYSLQFKNYTSNNNLSCQNETDQFAVSNNKAKLTYPVSLINTEELYNISTKSTSSLRKTGADYWGLSPLYFGTPAFNSNSGVRYVSADGGLFGNQVNYTYGSRPAVTLSTGAVISSGDGSEESPWIVE